MAIETFPKGVTKQEFLAALKFVFIRESARLESGVPGLAMVDAYFASGGAYENVQESVRNAVEELVDAGMQGAVPGMRGQQMNWGEWACFCRYYLMLDLDARKIVLANMSKGFSDPWNVETSDGRTTLPSPVSPCAQKGATGDMFCCPRDILYDALYAGVMPGHRPGYSMVEWILISAGVVAAASTVVIVGAGRGWFGSRTSGR